MDPFAEIEISRVNLQADLTDIIRFILMARRKLIKMTLRRKTEKEILLYEYVRESRKNNYRVLRFSRIADRLNS